LCLPAAYYLEGPASLLDFRASDVLRLAGTVLILLSVVLFSGFLRIVGRCVGGRRGWAVIGYLSFVGFLIGCSVGLHLIPRRYYDRDAWVLLALGWFLSLWWNLFLIRRARGHVSQVLAKQSRLTGRAQTQPQRPKKGQVELQVAALLRKQAESASSAGSASSASSSSEGTPTTPKTNQE
jgi:hypothetical protein